MNLIQNEILLNINLEYFHKSLPLNIDLEDFHNEDYDDNVDTYELW